MSKLRSFVAIGEAAKALGVSIATLRRWEESGKLAEGSVERTEGGQRRYDLAVIRPEMFRASSGERKTIAYARVSSHDQKDDLELQDCSLPRVCATAEAVRSARANLRFAC